MDGTTQNISRHAQSRAWERLIEAKIDPMVVLRHAAAAAAAHPEVDFAALVVTLPATVGDRSEDILSRESNGNQVWAICRDGLVVTLMLRRSDQPATAAALRVQRIARFA